MYKRLLVLTFLIIIGFYETGTCQHTNTFPLYFGICKIKKANPEYTNVTISSVVIIGNFHKRLINKFSEYTNFYNDFEDTIQDEFTKVDINSKCVVMNKYVFKKPDIDKIISDMNPTVIINIDEEESTVEKRDPWNLYSLFKTEIIDSKSKEPMWQAQIEIRGLYLLYGGMLSSVLFRTISNSTRNDGMILFQ